MDILIKVLFKIFSTTLAKIKKLSLLSTMKITENIFSIKCGTVNFYIYQKGHAIIAIDSGYCKPVIEEELNRMNIKADKIYHLFLTHSDIDHAGGLLIFKNANIFISGDEEQMISHRRPRKFGFLYNSSFNKPYILLKDNDEVSIGSIRIKAIETPGHTPGSMSYIIDDEILFVGDAIKLFKGKAKPNRSFSMDYEKQLESIRKIAEISGIKYLFTAHRGYTKDFDKAMEDWK
jgi:glyoxylase-like metal-dependent hydrolase (beta-lactamase superfamily II)